MAPAYAKDLDVLTPDQKSVAEQYLRSLGVFATFRDASGIDAATWEDLLKVPQFAKAVSEKNVKAYIDEIHQAYDFKLMRKRPYRMQPIMPNNANELILWWLELGVGIATAAAEAGFTEQTFTPSRDFLDQCQRAITKGAARKRNAKWITTLTAVGESKIEPWFSNIDRLLNRYKRGREVAWAIGIPYEVLCQQTQVTD